MANVSNERHVAVFPFPFASHFGTLFRLVRCLAADAPTVTFSFFSTPKTIESLFSPSKNVPGNIKPYVVPDGVPEGHVFSGNPEEPITLYITAVEDGKNLKGVLKAAEAEGRVWYVRCVSVVRRRLGGRDGGAVGLVYGFSELRLGDLPTGVLFGNLESPFAIMQHKMGRALPKATAIAINSIEELDPDIIQDLKSKFKMILNVSPFSAISLPSSPLPLPPSSYTDEYGCIPWLDNCKPASVAYIGFGTLATPPPVEVL
ncbi:hypothetical protein RHGRI_003942 [Rhododendron griersonianum]|uniref:Uncharacterized protein n=1 Tax=Rhododendron griersonianum TaxID=479676 RepID=A0AAV6L8R4_9ERIC|nr:hypothetical protein RHGRI_003942 [Rhododendron griersonianum]